MAEVGNAIWKKVRRRELTARQARDLATDILHVAVETVPVRGLIEDACGIAVTTSLTVYDATYVALAVRLETTVITADERLVRAAASHRMVGRHVRAVHEIA